MHSTEFELLERLAAPRCAVCDLAAESARDYLAGVMADGVNDGEVRGDWRRRGGLCPRHWRVWRNLETPPLSSAIMTQDLLGSYLASGRPAKLECPACEVETGAARRYLQALRKLPAKEVLGALEQGRGFLCLRHLDKLPEGPLKEAFHRRLERVVAELAEFVRKSDYRFAQAPKGEAGDSWLRAIRALGGEV